MSRRSSLLMSQCLLISEGWQQLHCSTKHHSVAAVKEQKYSSCPITDVAHTQTQICRHVHLGIRILHFKWLALPRSKFNCGVAIMRILWIRILWKWKLQLLDPWRQCGSWSLSSGFIFCWVVQTWTASPIGPRRGRRHMVLPAGCRVGVGGSWRGCETLALDKITQQNPQTDAQLWLKENKASPSIFQPNKVK